MVEQNNKTTNLIDVIVLENVTSRNRVVARVKVEREDVGLWGIELGRVWREIMFSI